MAHFPRNMTTGAAVEVVTEFTSNDESKTLPKVFLAGGGSSGSGGPDHPPTLGQTAKTIPPAKKHDDDIKGLKEFLKEFLKGIP